MVLEHKIISLIISQNRKVIKTKLYRFLGQLLLKKRQKSTLPLKSLNVYVFGMKISQPITANLSCDWLRGVHIRAKIVHVQEL